MNVPVSQIKTTLLVEWGGSGWFMGLQTADICLMYEYCRDFESR